MMLDAGYLMLDTRGSIFNFRYYIGYLLFQREASISYKKLEIWQLSRELVVDLHQRIELLGKKLNVFIQSVERVHKSEK